jgi:hypothetical protein
MSRSFAKIIWDVIILEAFVGNRTLILYLLLGHVTDDVNVSAPAEEGILREKRAQCAQGFLPCKDNKCYCCIGGRTHDCYYTMAQCSHACF